MKGKFKSMVAAVLAVCICIGMAGCENDKEKDLDNISEKDFIENIEKLETLYEDDSNSAGAEDDLQDETPSAGSTEEEYKIILSDEIKNADFSSGLIQLNNEVFQQGGYITVADFVEKYKDSYDITYKDGTYEERTDYLVEYYDNLFENKLYKGKQIIYKNYLVLTSKFGSSKNKINVCIANMTSPDEKIPLGEAIVLECKPVEELTKSYAPLYVPNGFPSKQYGYDGDVELKEINKGIDVNEFIETIEKQGFELFDKQRTEVKYTTDFDKKYINGDTIYLYVLGEKNLFEARPFYEVLVPVNTDTDKISAYAHYYLRAFVEE